MGAERVGISIGVTLSIGNYESVRADARYDFDVLPGTKYDDAWSGAVDEAKAGLQAALDGLKQMLQNRSDFQIGPEATKISRR